MRVGKAVPLLTWTAIQSSRSPPSAFPPNIPTRLMPSCLQTHRSMALPRERFSLPLRWASVSDIKWFLVMQDDRSPLSKPRSCCIKINVFHGFSSMFFQALASVLAVCAVLGNKFLDHLRV